jgi:hypothetical protein
MTKIKWTTTFFKLTFIFPHLYPDLPIQNQRCIILKIKTHFAKHVKGFPVSYIL